MAHRVHAHGARDLFVPKNAAALRAKLKEAIVQRFRESRIAGDTAHGIRTSWLPEKGLEAAPLELVAEVLEDLVKEEILGKKPVTGGDPQYRRGPRFPEGRR
jgi:hypothetical protein